MAPNVGLNLAVNAVKNGMNIQEAAEFYKVSVEEINSAITRELLPSLYELPKSNETKKVKKKPMMDAIIVNQGEILAKACKAGIEEIRKQQKEKMKKTLSVIRNSIPEQEREEFDKDPIKYIKNHPIFPAVPCDVDLTQDNE